MTQSPGPNADVHRTVDSELTADMCELIQLAARQMMDGFPLVQRWDETDDICQEAALRMHRALQAMEPESRRHVENLVALQIRRTLIDRARKYFRTVDQCAARWTPQTAAATQDGLYEPAVDESKAEELLQSWTALHSCVDQMPEPERETFQLIWYRGLRRIQVAELQNVNVSTVQRRWRSAREFLIRQLGPDFLKLTTE